MAKLDLRRFFPSSNGVRVFNLFYEDFQCPRDVAAIMIKLCTVVGTDVEKRPHLPTGGVSSPILSYLCYHRMFEQLRQLAAEEGGTLSVYYDDITISGLPRGHNVLARAEEIIRSHSLRINYRKRKNLSSGHLKSVTGVALTPKGIRVEKEWKDRVHAWRAAIATTKSLKKVNKLYRKVHGLLSTCALIEPVFKRDANWVLLEWKKHPAWRIHQAQSAERNGRKKKLRTAASGTPPTAA
jgi:hypothetical protein